MNRRTFKTIALLMTLSATTSIAHGSGATFEIRGVGIKLGEPQEIVDNGKTLIVFHATTQAAKPFTLAAQGIVLPRGGKPMPSEPESAKWTFDEKAVKELAIEKKDDKTTISIRVAPTAVGVTRLRFVGTILGYERKIDVIVDVQK